MIKYSRISVIGLGKLGAPMAAVFANKGFPVTGVDSDPVKVEKLGARVACVNETGLGWLLRSSTKSKRKPMLETTSDIKMSVFASDVTFICVATPSKEDGSYSLKYILEVCRNIGEALRNKPEYHTVVVTSTVMPGDTNTRIKETLEFFSNKKEGIDFGLCYNPEFIALGSVIQNFKNPDMLLIGENSAKDGDILVDIYNKVVENTPIIQRMSIVNAEITKIAINTYITTKISYANMLANICEKFPGGDVDVVCKAMGSDSRIGNKYLKAGANYAGPCFPRDNRALSQAFHSKSLDSFIPTATDLTNEKHKLRILSTVLNLLSVNKMKVGVLGLPYKLDTDITEESLGKYLVEKLLLNGCEVLSYLPGTPGFNHATIEGIIVRSDVIVIAMPHEEIKDIAIAFWQGKIVIDCWRILKHLKDDKTIEYIGIGLGE